MTIFTRHPDAETLSQYAARDLNGTARVAIGSHLENLQRKGGFKGFNQHAVSLIIAKADPRKQAAARASS